MKSSATAQIVKIDAVDKHPNADSLDICTVGGWKVVTRLNEFKPGDLAVYCRIDSWIPTALAPFLSKGQEPREYNGVKGERLKTVKLRGQLSQGLLLPIETTFWRDPGTDVSESLNIQKWEAPVSAQLAGQVKGNFPTQVPKTDEERIQNLTTEWPEISALTYEVTEKLEGSSMTVGVIDSEFVVCSRNLNLKETEGNSFWAAARRYDIEAKMRELSIDNLVLQGELIGEGVQGNHYQLRGLEFYVFAVYDVKRGEYVDPTNRKIIVERLGLKHVPVIHEALHLDGKTVDQVLEMANGESQLLQGALREGLVFKQVNGQAHWKAISNQYLLKHG